MRISDWSSDVCSSDLGVDMACEGDTLAEGIAVKEPGAYTRKIVAELNDDIVLVAERHLERAVSLLLQIEKTVVEGGGAAGVAAMLAPPEAVAGGKVGLVLTGGKITTTTPAMSFPPRSHLL